MHKERIRRILFASLPSSVIGVGFVGPNDKLRVEVVERHGELSLGEYLQRAIVPYEPEEVIAIFPGAGAQRDPDADRYVHSVLIGLACPRTSILHSWRELDKLENEHASAVDGAKFKSQAHEILRRLHWLQRCMALDDVRLGEDMPFTSEAVSARWDIAVTAAAKEQQRRIAAEREVAELRRIVAMQEEMTESLRAALLAEPSKSQ